ncbi:MULTISPECIES: hypothetical protein [Methanothermobacter]|jgi:hypothetical protein|uniref:hypothetical protein n=1 Tax=Methanothermobacter TaxID=145260 RepID=UPI000B5FF25F|nr:MULTISPECIES: hypothetical protein [Methanothermobacter]MBC7111476.1 hypothetical protein [Methanothermobacter sp.]MDK2874905.1 hypothetical protein [Methanothermobacter sp.]MDN5373438.1 hypothetical protein [Methanothermobacter sp.]WBF07742.1 hypothetical protein ISG36_06945 [Methanothermobacter thermautotrophicus]BAZ99434.1 hypothetical protein tca_01387 [Methanothermobacter sp. EMTCatA1]
MRIRRILRTLTGVLPFAGIMAAGVACGASCPYGLVNDPYPGQCPRFTDLNGDGICDLSQSTTDYSTSDDTSRDSSNDQSTSDDSAATSDDSVHSGGVDAPDETLQHPSVEEPTTDYHLIPLSLILIAAYMITLYLMGSGRIRGSVHRRIWNIILTAGYAGTGVTGVLLLLFIRLGIKTALNPSVTYWHAELAILMVIGTLIHIHIYWKQFRGIFRHIKNQISSP